MNPLFQEISALPTERKNLATELIDTASMREILELINDEDSRVAFAVRQELPFIEQAVEFIVAAFRAGGRLIYAGAGTSGRLGIVDASECPPTFGSPPEMVQAIIAGGRDAVFQSQEGSEDNQELGADEIQLLGISEHDVVCGIAASGRTPFVLGAMEMAKSLGAKTLLVTTNNREQLNSLGISADVLICPNVGAEVIAGSTRMKSGTAQKLILNMLTTASMIRIGKTYGNVMIDLQMTNAKLRERAKKIVMEITDVDYETAEQTLISADWNVKTALVMLISGVDYAEAKKRITSSDGFVRKALMKI